MQLFTVEVPSGMGFVHAERGCQSASAPQTANSSRPASWGGHTSFHEAGQQAKKMKAVEILKLLSVYKASGHFDDPSANHSQTKLLQELSRA